MATRSTKKTAVADAVDATVKREETKREEPQINAAMFEALGIPMPDLMPSPKTLVVALIANLAVCAIGIVAAAYLASFLLVAMLMLSWPGFIALCVYCFVWMLGVVASVYAGSVAARYVASGQAAAHIESAGGWLKSKFDSTSTAVKNRMASLRGSDGETVH